MRRFISFCLIFIYSIAIYAGSNNEKKCRPVKSNYAKYSFETKKGKKYTFLPREWYEVQTKDIGNAIVGSDTVLSNNDNCILNYNERGLISEHQPLDIDIVRYNDSLYVNVPSTQGTAWFYVIDQTHQKRIDSCNTFNQFVHWPIPEECTAIRVSPENRIVSIFSEIPEATKDTTTSEGFLLLKSAKGRIINSLRIETPKEPLQVEDEDNSISLLTIILISIIVVLLLPSIYGIYYFFNKKDITDTDYTEDQSGRLKDLEKAQKELSKVNNKLAEVQNELSEVQNELTDKKNELSDKEGELNKKEKEYKKLSDKNQEIKKQLEKEKDKRENVEKELKSIEDKLKAQHEKELDKIESEKKAIFDYYEAKKKKLNETEDVLRKTTATLENRNAEIVRLKEAQEKYTTTVTYVPFASQYVKDIQTLLSVSHQLQNDTLKLLDMKLPDPYHVMKGISKYMMAISKIDMLMFFSDIRMISEGEMVLNSTTLSSFDQNEGKAILENKTRQYFFDKYLEKYVNAIVVLSESMQGVNRLVEGIPDAFIKQAKSNGQKIMEVVGRLGLKVETAHLFDKVGSKIDLNATLVDAGFKTGDILEIENCLVYFEGGKKPDTKIKVKVQD